MLQGGKRYTAVTKLDDDTPTAATLHRSNTLRRKSISKRKSIFKENRS